MRWASLVPLLKDIVLSGTGVFAILYEILSLHPNGLVLGTGLALTVPSVAEHVKALLPSSGGGGGDAESSPSSSSAGAPQSPHSLPTKSAGE